nr:MAG TPA: hypothetical protein [Caudoviricetes sp.]
MENKHLTQKNILTHMMLKYVFFIFHLTRLIINELYHFLYFCASSVKKES